MLLQPLAKANYACFSSITSSDAFGKLSTRIIVCFFTNGYTYDVWYNVFKCVASNNSKRERWSLIPLTLVRQDFTHGENEAHLLAAGWPSSMCKIQPPPRMCNFDNAGLISIHVTTIVLQYSHVPLERVHTAEKHMATILYLTRNLCNEMDHDFKERRGKKHLKWAYGLHHLFMKTI
jgi:hypothetical protein